MAAFIDLVLGIIFFVIFIGMYVRLGKIVNILKQANPSHETNKGNISTDSDSVYGNTPHENPDWTCKT